MVSPTFFLDKNWRAVDCYVPPENVKTFYDAAWLKKKLKDSVKKIRETKRQWKTLFIFDDVGGEKIKSRGHNNELDKLMMLIRHYGCSIWISVQNITSMSIPTRSNCDGAAIYNTVKKHEIEHYYDEFGFGSKKEFRDAFNLITKKAHHFMFINHQLPVTKYFKNYSEEVRPEDLVADG